jgi:hypothetical protein
MQSKQLTLFIAEAPKHLRSRCTQGGLQFVFVLCESEVFIAGGETDSQSDSAANLW